MEFRGRRDLEVNLKRQKWVGLAALAVMSSSWLMGSQAQNVAGGPGAHPGQPGGAGFPGGQSVPATAPDLAVTLDVVGIGLHSGRGLKLRMTVENQGQTPVTLLRQRSGWLEYSGPDAWNIRIDGPGGSYQFPVYLGWVALPTDADLVTLRQGESFGTLIDMGDAFLVESPAHPKLSETPGTYLATVSFHAPLDKGFLNFLKAKGALLQPLHSNTLEFNVWDGE